MTSSQNEELVATLNEFKQQTLQLEIQASQKGESGLYERFKQVVDKLNELLCRLDLDISEKQQRSAVLDLVTQELGYFIRASEFNWRSLIKPQGYAGDYKVIGMVYEQTPKGYGFVGKSLDKWTIESHGANAVRKRREFLYGEIREKYNKFQLTNAQDTFNVMSIACGPCAEMIDVLNDSTFMQQNPRIQFTGLDVDLQAIEYVNEQLQKIQRPGAISLIKANAVRVALGKEKVSIPANSQHIVYSVGLTDYLEDKFVISLLDYIYEVMAPGGMVCIGNFTKNNDIRGWLEFGLNWKLIYRTKEDLLRLVTKSKFGAGEVKDDGSYGIQLFVTTTKIPTSTSRSSSPSSTVDTVCLRSDAGSMVFETSRM